MKTNLTSALHRFKTRLLALVLPAALSITMAQAQTIIVNPATDGGFEMGTGSLADNGWTAVSNGTANPRDRWFTGSGKTSGAYSFPSNTRCAYVDSSVAGTSWAAAGSSGISNVPHMYKTVTVAAGQTNVVLSFKYTQKGASNVKLMVYVCDDTMTPNSSDPQGNTGTISATGWGTGNVLLLFSAATPLPAGTQTFSAPIPQSFLNNCSTSKTFKLVFSAFKGTTANNDPPPAVDSISLVSSTPISAAPGIFTINNTLPTSGTNFKSFTEAITWVNAVAYCGLPNAITFNVSAGQTFDENTPYITASGTSTKQIIFQKSGTGANPVIRPTGEYGAYQPTSSNPGTQDYGICLHGADYITFDGIDIISNDKLPNFNLDAIAVEYGFLIRNASGTNGATNNTIKNTTILLNRNASIFNATTPAPATRGIVQTCNTLGGGVSATSALGTNDNNSYYNFTIGNVAQGIVLYGSGATLPDRNTKIGTLTPGTFNVIGRPGVADDIGGNIAAPIIGINLNYQYDAIVSNNIIQNLTSSSAASTGSVDGILIGASNTSSVFNGSAGFNNEISNNQISFLKSTAPNFALNVTGIRVQHESAGSLGPIVGFKIYNNTVSNLTSAYTGVETTARSIKGIWLQAGAPTSGIPVQYEIVNNTVVIDGSSSPKLSSIAFENAYASTILKLRNNVFYNKTGAQTGGATGATHYVLGITNATSLIGTTGSISDYNDLYYSNATGGLLSYNNNVTTLSGWQSLFGVDASSISADPKLNSTTVLSPLNPSPLTTAGPTLSTPYNRDVLGVLRAVGNSTLGAFEKVGDIVKPAISDTSIVGVNSITSRSFPGLLKVVDADGMVANTAATAPRIYYKKPSNANAFGANTSAFNGWKWVVATNTASPFDLNINYALLTSAVAIGDTIQYFFVAQDTVVTPNVSALPAEGFAGTSVSNITSAPTSPKSYRIYGTPAAYVSSTSAQPNTSGALIGTNNNAILQVSLQTGATGDSAYVTEMSFNSSSITDLTNIGGVKVWYSGTSATFDINSPTIKQLGSTYTTPAGSGALGTVTFTGAQIVPPNSTVYFWLTYDIKGTATIADQLDASIISLTYSGTSRTPVLLSPPGFRKVKQQYCIPVPPSSSRHISVVAFNTLNNNVGTATFLSPFYVNYTPTGAATTTVKRGATYNLSLTPFTGSTSLMAFIDYNDNGVFDANETYNVNPNSPPTNVAFTVPISIPCDAVVSQDVRMRIISYFTASPWTNNWCTAGNGEVQDYTISIIDNAVDYVASSATQSSGTVSPLATNKIMMKLPIVTSGCGGGFLTEVKCNTGKTMNPAANIQVAKLYSTGKSSSFTTGKLLATVASPFNTFSFQGFSDSLYSIKGDTTYYWITYDMTASATLNDTIDVRIDSINATGRYVIPGNNNPPEYLLVKAKNTYTNSNVIHSVVARTPRVGQLYTPIIRVRIVNTNAGAPIQLTQMNFDPAGGGNDSLNIAAARVFYTGNSSTFLPVNQFGNTYTAVGNMNGTKWNPFNIQGVQDLNFDTNYFWLAYDIGANASTIDSVDGDLVSFTLGSILTPTSKSVTGALPIKPSYCAMLPSIANVSSTGQGPDAFEDITLVQFGSINNASVCGQTGGVGSIPHQYADYTDLVAPATIFVGDTVNFTLGGVGNCNQTTSPNSAAFAILIDWNKDGAFDATTEVAYRSTASSTVRTVTDKLLVPCAALPGNTRMRIIYGAGTPASLGTVCGNTSGIYLYGETEDYTVNVVSNPVTTIRTSFVQQTATIAAGVADAQILRVAVKPKGCGATLNEMRFTNTSTSLANITAAKLYSTGNSTNFSTTNLLGTVAPANTMIFTGLSAALTNNAVTDSTYFWLAYDVATSATVGNTLDAKLDSLNVGGSYYNTVTPGNPGGSRAVAARMTFTSTAVTQPDTATVAVGTANKQILRILVTGSNTNGPVPITSLSFNVNGSGNNLLNVDSARVYYTGSSATFATTTQFGNAYSAAPGTWSSFTINGNVPTSTTANYFWLVYDIKPTATILDSVDAELTSVTFDGIVQPYTGGASSGNSKIRGAYCQTTHQGNTNQYYIINSVTIGGTTTAGTGRTIPFYIDNTTATAVRNLSKGPNTMSVTTQDNATGVGGSTYVYIDYDQNGDFTGPNEMIFSGATPQITAVSITYSIPCNVKTGLTRMRVTTSLSSTPPSLCAFSTTYGETEDYTVNIQESPLTFISSSAVQTSGTAGRGENNKVIMNIKVRANGCGVPLLTNMYFNTIGSNSPATDIVAAKLYRTGTSTVFNTSTLLGTVPSPNGVFNFTTSAINDAMVTNDTTNYWLVYDVSSGAISGDTLDARVDSIIVMGAKRIPTNNSPAQFKKVLTPMTIIDVRASYPSGDRVGQGTANYQALGLMVVASSTGASIPVTSINFNTIGGGNDLANLNSATVYYTGNSKTFATTTTFGTTYTPGSNVLGTDWLPYTIPGYVELANDTNYFWLTYNIKANATLSDSVDAEAPSVMIAGVSRTVTNSAPAGNAIIRQEYCFSSSSSTSTSCIDSAQIGTFKNRTVGACASYTNYPKTTVTTDAYLGSTLPVTLWFTAPTRASVFIDLNRNGFFETSEEFNIAPNFVASVSTSIKIPTTALLGETRLRLRTFGGGPQNTGSRACENWNQSETEDYTINILPALPQVTYTWNNAGTSDYTLPSNWIPTRASSAPSDNLVFNAKGSTLNITNITTHAITSFDVKLGTTVNLNAAGTASLQISGALTLADSAKINCNSNLTIEIGTDVGTPGSLTVGSVSGINATIKRWVNPGNINNLLFPIVKPKGSRALNINFTYAPTSYGSLVASFVSTKALGDFGFPLYEGGIGANITKTCSEGYWTLDAADGLSSGIYFATFAMDSVAFLPNPYITTIVNRADAFNPWSLNGSYGGVTYNKPTTTISKNTIQGYGQFTFASDSMQNPLPVTLTTFTAKAAGNDVQVQWNTASEVNNSGFDLERSVDGKSFEQVAFVKGNGTSTVAHNYAYNDDNAFANANILYYRLKQLDADGHFTYSPIVRVSSNMQSASAVSVFPNPFTAEYSVALDVRNDATVTMVMTDIQGRTVASETVLATKGNNNLTLKNIAALQAGVYFLKVNVEGETQVIKLIKN